MIFEGLSLSSMMLSCILPRTPVFRASKIPSFHGLMSRKDHLEEADSTHQPGHELYCCGGSILGKYLHLFALCRFAFGDDSA